jgi:hypothetical protein
MKHFDITEWSDFTRGTVPVPERALMETHLSSGCTRCGSAFEFVNEVVTVARQSWHEEPPPDAVRWAKALVAMHRPPRGTVQSLIARLVFDSVTDPVPAGIRSGDAALRYAVYVAGNFCIDLHFQQDVEARTATIMGQMTDRETPDRAMTGKPVLLVSGQRVVAHCISNKFGEFSLNCNPQRQLRLLVGTDEHRNRIEVPLDPFVGSGPKGTVRHRRK